MECEEEEIKDDENEDLYNNRFNVGFNELRLSDESFFTDAGVTAVVEIVCDDVSKLFVVAISLASHNADNDIEEAEDDYRYEHHEGVVFEAEFDVFLCLYLICGHTYRGHSFQATNEC